MENVILEVIKPMVLGVNESLKYYEDGYTSVQRCPIISREPVDSLKMYVECRFNREAFNSSVLEPYAKYFDGYLFNVVYMNDEDPKKRRYTEVCLEVCKDPSCFEDFNFEDVTYFEIIEEVQNILGGSRIYFNQSAKIPKIRRE